MGKIKIPADGDTINPGEIRVQKVTFGDGLDVEDPTVTSVVQLADINVGAHGNVTIHEVAVDVTTAFIDAGGTSATNVTLTVGDGDDADGFLQSADIAPGSVSRKSSKETGQPYSGVKEYTADDTIDVTVGGAAPASSGAADVLIMYSVGLD